MPRLPNSDRRGISLLETAPAYLAKLATLSFFPQTSYWFKLYALCVWGEARNQVDIAMVGMAWTVRNRATHPGWWGGPSFKSVILAPYQYSYFNGLDLNNLVFPTDDAVWEQCLSVVNRVCMGSAPDPTFRATNYYDQSLDNNPPAWAATMTHTVNIGAFRFFR